MKVIPNNCVSKIKLPIRKTEPRVVDYNPDLGLYAACNMNDGAFVWNPLSGKVVARFEELGEGFRDTLFLPGNRLAVSSSEGNHLGSIDIYIFGEDHSISAQFEIVSKDLPVDYPGALALSPGGNLLVSDAAYFGLLHEVFVDWDNLKILKSREVIIPATEEEDFEDVILLLSCSQEFEVVWYVAPSSKISVGKVSLNTEGELEMQGQETITYYVLDGEEKRIDYYPGPEGLVHDGQNLIIANGDEIVLLESATEGSTAHLIASGVKPTGQIRINHEGQLMVCEEKVIKLFEYKNEPRSLQSLCRCHIRKTIPRPCAKKVNKLMIPSILKDYLLYKSN